MSLSYIKAKPPLVQGKAWFFLDAEVKVGALYSAFPVRIQKWSVSASTHGLAGILPWSIFSTQPVSNSFLPVSMMYRMGDVDGGVG